MRNFIASAPGDQNIQTVRQLQQIQTTIDSILVLVNQGFKDARQSAPIVITELNSPLEILRLEIPVLPAGNYNFSVNFRASYTGIGDQLFWEIQGTLAIGPFIQEAKAANEQIPQVYGSTFFWDGSPLTLVLVGSVAGPGSADVIIEGAALTVTRVLG